jgi:hypothetical protein
MLTNSRDIIRRLEREGWLLMRITRSHHVSKNVTSDQTVVVPHPEALELYAESFEADGKPLPRPRTLTELKTDPEIAGEMNTYMVALIELPTRAHAAE